jgi:hypothetical protein
MIVNLKALLYCLLMTMALVFKVSACCIFLIEVPLLLAPCHMIWAPGLIPGGATIYVLFNLTYVRDDGASWNTLYFSTHTIHSISSVA